MSDKLCSFCGKRQVHAKGLCSNCYARYLKNGTPEYVKVRIKKECSFCGKVDYLKAKGLCSTCYARYLRQGTPGYTKVKKIAKCAFCEEEKEIKAHGLCSSCYQRYKKNGTPEYRKIKKICSIDGCEEFVVANGLCEKHYRRWRRHDKTSQTRPRGWGAKGTHPLYNTWSHLKRYHTICDDWKDFWVFVHDVGERPTPKHKFIVIDSSKEVDKDNYEWSVGIVSKCDGESDKSFRNRYAKLWRKKNGMKCQDINLRRHYGMTVDDYEKMLKEQCGVCAICGKPEFVTNQNGNIRKLAVDHCHESGKIRGLLCTNCNKGIGHLQDSIELLQNAINYFTENKQEDCK